MPQPPPRKVKPTAALKSLHSDHISKLQTKHQQECDLLEDIRTFSRQRSIIEKEYAQALIKLTTQLLKRDFQAMPDLSSEDGQEHRTAMAVWRVILEETDVLAKKRLQASEVYLERISEPVKPLKATKVQCMKKVSPQLTTLHGEVGQTVTEMTKAHKTYSLDETQAYDARSKTNEAEDKLNKKSKGIFTSLASLQKNHAKLKTRTEACETKSTESRNEYLLCMAAANAHQKRYFTTDLPNLMEILDGEIFERIQEYFAVYGNTAQEISCYENRSCNRIVEQTSMINRNFDLKCFLYTNKVFTDLVQYEFEPCLEDKCNTIERVESDSHHLDKEARKWATKIAKENKAIKEYQRSLKAIGSGDKVSESGSAEGVSQDPEVKLEELNQNIRRSETAKMKAEARIEALRAAGVNVEEWLSSANVDSLGADEDLDLPRTPSHTSLWTESSGVSHQSHEQEEPTYTHYDVDDDFLDDTFDVPVTEITLKGHSSQHPIKCRSIYEFHASKPDELDMEENEELEIVANGDGDGWVRAKNSKGLIGFIPENYISVLDGGEPPCDDTYSQHADQISQQGGSMEDSADVYSPPPPMSPTSHSSIPTIEEPENEAEFPPPPMSPPSSSDITQEVTSYSSGDMEVQQTTDTMTDNMQLPVGDGVWVRAIYDYEGTSPEELSFTEGTLIKIIRKDENGIDDGFWEGEANGLVGVFPSLVVEELTQEGNCQEFPSPLVSPPDYMPPPPVTVTAATPESETPPTPIANGSEPEVVEVVDDASPPTEEQYKRRVHFSHNRYYSYSPPSPDHQYSYHSSYTPHKLSLNSYDIYDSTYDDEGEESLV